MKFGMTIKNFAKQSVGAVFAICLVLGASAEARELNINIGKDSDLLEQLIELDEAGIADMRADFAEARADIDEAIADIFEAREDVKSAPGGRFFMRIAFAAAREATSGAVSSALSEVDRELDRAERRLTTAEISDEERAETRDAISALREELAALRAKLDELVAAMKA